MLGSCSWKIIHLESETSRNDLVKSLQDAFHAKVFPALRAEDVAQPGYPLRHPLHNEPVSKGMIGCAESHRRVLIEGLFDGTPYVGVFEDDAVQCVSKDTIQEWIDHAVPRDWDILCLATNEHVKPVFSINQHTVQLERFWGTHAMIVKRETITKLLGMFEQLQQQGIQPIADWWYSAAITQYNLRCYAPLNPKAFFVQKVGLTSAITGKVRM